MELDDPKIHSEFVNKSDSAKTCSGNYLIDFVEAKIAEEWSAVLMEPWSDGFEAQFFPTRTPYID